MTIPSAITHEAKSFNETLDKASFSSNLRSDQVLDPLSAFGLTIGEFYGLVKSNIGELSSNQYLQLGVIAKPLDVAANYPWFSLRNLIRTLDLTLEPAVVSNVSLREDIELFREYSSFCLVLSRIVALSRRDLTEEEKERLTSLDKEAEELSELISILEVRRKKAWHNYCDSNDISYGDISAKATWSQSYYGTAKINLSYERTRMIVAETREIKLREYPDPRDQEVIDAWAAVSEVAATWKLPNFEDSLYGKESERFSIPFFASQPRTKDVQYDDVPNLVPDVSLSKILEMDMGSIRVKIEKLESSNSNIITDWKASGEVSGDAGLPIFVKKPCKVTAKVDDHTEITNDFKHTKSIEFGAKAIFSVGYRASWFNPGILKHPKIAENIEQFERFLGPKGTLLFTPVRVVLARGISIKFTSTQNWKYDYVNNFSRSESGSASASFFGVNFGKSSGSESTSDKTKLQHIRNEGVELEFGDGDNIRVIGYIVSHNKAEERRLEMISDYNSFFT